MNEIPAIERLLEGLPPGNELFWMGHEAVRFSHKKSRRDTIILKLRMPDESARRTAAVQQEPGSPPPVGAS
jgi:hypothetical protein